MRAILFIVVVFFWVVFVRAGTCPDGSSSKSIDSKTRYCRQYASDSCCSPNYIDASCWSDDGCRRRPDGCDDLLGIVDCAIKCRPNMNQLYDQSGRLNVCASFYDRVVDACKGVRHCNSSSVNCFASSPQMSPYCSYLYDPPSKVWDLSSGPANRVTDNTNCFNTASSIVVSFGLLLCALFVALF